MPIGTNNWDVETYRSKKILYFAGEKPGGRKEKILAKRLTHIDWRNGPVEMGVH
jgi:hypothetical protein